MKALISRSSSYLNNPVGSARDAASLSQVVEQVSTLVSSQISSLSSGRSERPMQAQAERELLSKGSTMVKMTMTEARPALLAIFLRKFFERGRYPELLLSCIFHLWRLLRLQTRWKSSLNTDLSRNDAESASPSPPPSKTSAASFACFESLGVKMPPTKGWVAQKRRDSQGDSPGERSPHQAEWYENPFNREWVYHHTEDMYFHLPTSSLWEKREVVAACPDEDRNTYVRVDALHLTALHQFAQSMDSALVPMAWNAWVRYHKKRKAQKEQNDDGPPMRQSSKNDGGRQSSKVGGKSPGEGGAVRTQGERGTRFTNLGITTNQFDSRASDEGRFSEGVGSQSSEPMSLNPSLPMPDAPRQMASPGLPREYDGPLMTQIVSGDSMHVVVPIGDGPAEDTDPEPNDQPKGCCFFCGRSSRKNKYSKLTDAKAGAPVPKAGAMQHTPSGPLVAPSPSGSTAIGTAQPSVKSVKTDAENTFRTTESGKTSNVETLDRHQKRFDEFMKEVSKNPKKLVEHVEKRRKDATAVGYIIV